MKKSLLLLTALAIALSWACNRIENDFDFSTDPVDGVELTIHATQADASATRTVLMPDKSIYWTKGDAVNVFYGSQSSGLFSSDIEEPARTADFTGTLSVTVGSSGAGAGTQAFWGVYPYDENNTCDGSSVTLTLPSRQEALAGSFANKLNPSVATSSGLSLAFYNVGAPFYFSVTQEGVTSATFRGNNNEDLAGRIRVSMNADGCPVAEVLEGVKSITLSAPDGETFEPGTTYVLILLPQTFSAGYTVTFNKGVLQADCAVSKNVEFKRAKGRTKMDADEGLTYLPVGEAEIISFADDLVKSILVDHFDLDGDGEISTAEAAVVTTFNVPKATKNSTRAGSDEEASIMAGKDIEEFDEFVYFTGFTEVAAHTVEGCSRLKAIVLPETVIHLGDRAFYDCSSLHSVTVMSPTPPTLGVEVFGDDPDFAIYVPGEVLETYKERWSYFADRIFSLDKKAISFKDPLVKSICVENWDTNGDGELSYEEAAAVTSTTVSGGPYGFHQAFSNTEISSFDELVYFTNIQDICFSYCSNLSSIILPESVRSIGAYAFDHCTSLASINIPNTIIGDFAFYECTSLTSVTLSIQDSFRDYYIERYAFAWCSNLTEINIPDKVRSIGEYAFAGCSSLTSIHIPESLISIAEGIFSDCCSLTSVEMPEYDCRITDIEAYAFARCSSLTQIELPQSKVFTSIGEYAFAECSSLTSIHIPESLISIAEGAFSDCSSLTCVEMPEYGGFITEIGAYAFSGCSSLTQIDLPQSEEFTSIGEYTFFGCSNLANIVIPECISEIGAGAFSGCSSLYGAFIWGDVTSIEDETFMDCQSLRYADLPNSVTSIGSRAFKGCGFANIAIPNVSSIGSGAFQDCINLAGITIPDGVECIEDETFSGCSNLARVVIPEGVTTIGYDAFANCISLSEIAIPGSVNSVCGFVNCSGLSSVILNDGVTEITEGAFLGCCGLISVDIPASVERIGRSAFQECENLAKVNITSLESWCQIDFDIIWTGTNPLQYAHHLFLNGTDLTDLIIPDGVTSIGAGTFYYCNSLTTVTIPASVQSIGEKAFYECDGLTRVNISDLASWCSIEFQEENSNPLWYAEHLYLNGSELETIVFPEGLDRVNEFTFINLNSLSGVHIPEGVTSIGHSAFRDCDNLVDVRLPDGLIDINPEAFCFCYSLPEIVIPKSVTTIGSAAFLDCRSLTNVTVLPVTPPTAGWGFFEYAYDATFFVPEESVEDYKSAPYWRDLAGRIQAIPE